VAAAMTARDGGNTGNAGAVSGGPPGMVEIPEMQEQFPVDRQGWWKYLKCRSSFRWTARDGGNTGNAGAVSGGPPGMVEIPETQEQFPVDRQG
ncbi:MAG: hypothetical protein ACYDB9_09865, partial [Gammaproteobacteria bacterium]